MEGTYSGHQAKRFPRNQPPPSPSSQEPCPGGGIQHQLCRSCWNPETGEAHCQHNPCATTSVSPTLPEAGGTSLGTQQQLARLARAVLAGICLPRPVGELGPAGDRHRLGEPARSAGTQSSSAAAAPRPSTHEIQGGTKTPRPGPLPPSCTWATKSTCKGKGLAGYHRSPWGWHVSSCSSCHPSTGDPSRDLHPIQGESFPVALPRSRTLLHGCPASQAAFQVQSPAQSPGHPDPTLEGH